MAGGLEEPQGLRVVPVWKVPAAEEAGSRWLVDRLWSEEAVGVIGGAPKCAKSWLSLEMALAVASGAPCLGVFEIARPGPVLVLAAEDAPRQVRERLAGLAAVRGVCFDVLDVNLIIETRLELQLLRDQKRLADVIERHRPRLLILDPFIRLHGVDENSATEISGVLAKLRELQRTFGAAILVVHHTRKVNGVSTSQALRGSSDFHAWGDSNLYLKRKDEDLVLTIEHRAAASGTPLRLRLATEDGPPHLEVIEEAGVAQGEQAQSVEERVIGHLARTGELCPQDDIRAALRLRNQRLIEALGNLRQQGRVVRNKGCWSLARIETPA
jgi:hypothetical protein